ncbi:hypothetical protein BH10ACI3_BH10ACI3_24160 [soil metagenome]
MLNAVEAEIDASGNVRLLEPIEVTKTTRAVLTLLEEPDGVNSNSEKMLAFIRSSGFKDRTSYSPEEIEDQIKDARDSWE